MKDYKEILKGVVNIINTTEKSDIGFTNICKYIGENCPELIEDEDEKIRKELIDFIKSRLAGFPQCEKYIAWLEKQGKLNEKPTRDQVWDYCSKISGEWWQIAMNKWNTLSDEEKSKYNQFIGFNDFSDALMNITAGALFQLMDTGKLEYEEGSLLLEKPCDTITPIEEQDEQNVPNVFNPKFKVGDWITNDKGHSYLIAAIDSDDNRYLFEIGGYTHEQLNWEYIENADNHYHLWSIKDAKDGDVLVSVSNKPFIYNGRFNSISVGGYCGMNVINDFIVSTNYKGIRWTDNADITPATKEQRDALIKAMLDKEYFFDFNTKQLKKMNLLIESFKK